jgi:hypothetical protein
VMTAVFDPIGDRLDQPRRRPNPTRFYGATAIVEQPLDTYVEVELAAAGIAPAQLPPGDVVVLERSAGGRLTPLGRARAFHGSGVPSGTLRLAVGTATGLVGSRRVSEFSRDEAGRRLVEEVRIAIANRRGVPTEVLVREHLYRGLNWSLAYHNEVAALRKEAAQEIHFRVHLPGRATRDIIYRVVYTW